VDHVDADGCFTFTAHTDEHEYQPIRLSLPGHHQIENAIVVIKASEMLNRLGVPVSEEALIVGLQSVQWPGRLEWLNRSPRHGRTGSNGGSSLSSNGHAHGPAILLDGAHNHAGAVALRRFLENFKREPITFVFGAMRDKEISAMAKELFPRARYVVLTRVENERSADPHQIEPIVSMFCNNVMKTRTVEEALLKALAITPPHGMICIAGSLYLVGAVKEIWPTISHRLPAFNHQPSAFSRQASLKSEV
jgi:dihydrofolate synthase/folylpolyglutamate synthase